MENIVRNVRDIDNGDRRAIEHVVGQALRDNQRLVIQIVSLDLNDAEPAAPPVAATGQLPAWCNVYEGLNDAEIAELEKTVLTRADLTRTSE
ncbi:MAG: hypothetical protein J0M17_06870 [Planctomycetes bacterium]|nr:hypothetical protein [Planctomycetota bacterium]